MIGTFDDLSGTPGAGRILHRPACALDKAQPMG
jgi:hypothetical protein